MAVANITAMNGKNGLIYISAIASGQLYGANAWSVDLSHDNTEYAVMDDGWKSNFSGLKGYSVTLGAVADQATKQLYTAAAYDGLVSWWVYPQSNDITTFYSGSAVFGMSANSEMGSAVMRSATGVGSGTLSATGFS